MQVINKMSERGKDMVGKGTGSTEVWFFNLLQ